MPPISLKKGFVDELGKELVKHLLKIDEKDQNFKIAMDYVMSNFRFHRFLDVNPLDVSRSVQGLCSKFRVHTQDKKAVYLETLVEEFVNKSLTDEQGEEKRIQTDVHYGLLSFMLHSSNNPLQSEFIPKIDDQIKKPEEGFDWTGYLLREEEELTLGIDIEEGSKAEIFDSDDEFWDLTDDEFEDLHEEEEKHVPIIGKNVVIQKEDSDHEMITNVNWIHEHVVPSYWTDKEPLRFKINASDNYSQSYTDICKNWEIYKKSLNVLSDYSNYKLLSEKQLVIETLWMLQGVENLYVYLFQDDRYIPNKDIVVTHLTEETLRCYMETFTNIGDKVVELKKYSEHVLNGVETVSKSFKAFGYVLAKYLMERSVFLAEIEKTVINNEKTMTLLVLKGLLVDDIVRLKCIYQLYVDAVVNGSKIYSTDTERVVYFIDIFYARLYTYDVLGDAGIQEFIILLQMFLDVCQSYLTDMDKWMTMGQLPYTGDEEFMIYKAKDIQKGEADYWSQTYKIKETKVSGGKISALVPNFVKGMQNQILLAGKSLGLLAEFGNYATNMHSADRLYDDFKESLRNKFLVMNSGTSSNSDVADSDVIDGSLSIEDLSIDPLIRKNFKLMFLDLYNQTGTGQETNQCSKWVDKLQPDSCHPPIRLLLEKCLRPVISKRYDKACAFLLDFFRTELKLSQHLQVMMNFFLTEAGGTMHAFLSELFDMAKRKVYWQDVAYLNIVLQDALQMYYPDMIGNLKVDLQPSEIRSNLNLFDGLSLHYNAPWPITIILDVKTEQKYNEILKFLIKVKRAIWVLEQLRFPELIADISADTSCDSPNNSDDEDMLGRYNRRSKRDYILQDGHKQKLKLQMIILRMKMLHVLHSFHFYLMTRIKSAITVEFQPKMNNAKDLGEIIDIHHSFIQNLKKKCFLHENIGRSKEAIFKILTLVFDFEVLWQSGIHHIDNKKLDIIDNDFHRCKAFLHSFFSTLGKRGSYPHFEFLAHSLKS